MTIWKLRLRTLAKISTIVSAAACGGSLLAAPHSPVGTEVLRYSASIDARTTTNQPIVARLSVTNISQSSQRVEFYPCPFHYPVWLRAYRDVGGRVVWDSNISYTSTACLAVVAIKVLQPGDSTDFHLDISTTAVLGDSLPTGHYIFTITPEHLTPQLLRELGAGSTDLTR